MTQNLEFVAFLQWLWLPQAVCFARAALKRLAWNAVSEVGFGSCKLPSNSDYSDFQMWETVVPEDNERPRFLRAETALKYPSQAALAAASVGWTAHVTQCLTADASKGDISQDDSDLSKLLHDFLIAVNDAVTTARQAREKRKMAAAEALVLTRIHQRDVLTHLQSCGISSPAASSGTASCVTTGSKQMVGTPILARTAPREIRKC